MQIITTEDGSHTLFAEQFNEIYHSRHGAIQESQHVFIKTGLDYVLEQNKTNTASILEIGFGTGLNALLTMLQAEKRNLKINYTTIELYPVDIATIKELNYTQQLGYEYCYGPYHSMHLVRWNEAHDVTPHFNFKKINASVIEHRFEPESFDLIYFDAFAPDNQPEMWSVDVFKAMYRALKTGGILVTYCSKGVVQRTMKEAGFAVEKTPGPPGKREMLRAIKNRL
jgi:tRNA U34 5-methylaminomethyl-2-thiouridine-forming methyltransferase MnmC